MPFVVMTLTVKWDRMKLKSYVNEGLVVIHPVTKSAVPTLIESSVRKHDVTNIKLCFCCRFSYFNWRW